MPESIKKHLIFGCSMLLLFLLANTPWAYEEPECIKCHREGSTESTLHMNEKAFENSVHFNEITCTDCHADVTDDTHMEQKGSGKVDCSSCHDQENRHGINSQNVGTRPQCQDCHTKHAILGKGHPDSSVNPDNFPNTCGSCHSAQFGDAGFMTWLPSVQIRTHAKQDFSCDFDERDCLGCHQGRGAHGEQTPVNDAQCWKCHIPKGDRAAVVGDIHPKAAQKKSIYHGIAGILYGAAALVLMVSGCRFFMRRFSTKSGTRR